MSALPKHAPTAQGLLDSAFVASVLGKREARRLAALFVDAEARARARIEAAQAEVRAAEAEALARAERILAEARCQAEDIFAAARVEAEALIALLPDFAALGAAGGAAYRAIRAAADRRGLPMSAVTGRSEAAAASAARAEAVRAVAAACPRLSAEEIGRLFCGRTADAVREMMRRAG